MSEEFTALEVDSPRLPPDARPGHVRLRIRDMDRALAFYSGTLGLEAHPGHAGNGIDEVALRPSGSREPVVVLEADPGAPLPPRRSTGLFHLALLLPDRPALGRVLRHLRRSSYPLQGASDHAVSEAVYLADPEGNGIELYRDRPPNEWPRSGAEIGLVTEPLDVAPVLAAGTDGDWEAFPAGSRLGHVHLRVSSLTEAGTFYQEGLGLEVTHRSTPGALFLSAGGYHHHVAVNVWAGEGVPRPSPGSAGLVELTFTVPDAAGVRNTHRRLVKAGYEPRSENAGEIVVPDRDGIRVRVVSRGEEP